MRMQVAQRSLALCAVAAITGFSGCERAKPSPTSAGFVISSDMPLNAYVHLDIGRNGNPDTRFDFPVLQIYDESGELIYAGHNAEQNANALKGIPESTTYLARVAGAKALGDVIKQLPEFEVRRDEVTHSRRLTAVSVFLENCHACSTQEESLDKTQGRLHDSGVNLLVIHVSRTK